MGLICEHGQLRRQCEICERDDELREARRLLRESLEYVATCPDLTQPGGDELATEIRVYLGMQP